MGNISQETPMVAGPAKQGEDGCLIFAPGIVSGNTVPLALFPNTPLLGSRAKQDWLPDIHPRECIKKYCPLGNISQYTPKGARRGCVPNIFAIGTPY